MSWTPAFRSSRMRMSKSPFTLRPRDTSRRNSAATGDRKHVLNRHDERLLGLKNHPGRTKPRTLSARRDVERMLRETTMHQGSETEASGLTATERTSSTTLGRKSEGLIADSHDEYVHPDSRSTAFVRPARIGFTLTPEERRDDARLAFAQRAPVAFV
ncbi:MAG: hypothetical protein ABJC63_01905 [Gemmatimonadales bacterium]